VHVRYMAVFGSPDPLPPFRPGTLVGPGGAELLPVLAAVARP